MREPLINLTGVSKVYAPGGLFSQSASRRAVSDVTLSVLPGEILGIVGESGSGKSTLLRMILHLARPSSGRIELQGRDIWSLRGSDLKAFRRQVQPVFQNPASSFNPRQTVEAILRAPLEVHAIGAAPQHRETIASILQSVGLSLAHAARYPHQLSGGEKQRVAIARAIILSPSVVLADEPTSALDVSVQAQILRLFQTVRRDLGLTAIFVSHDLGVIREISDRVAVMRAGEIVELGPADRVFSAPRHAYTQALLNALPKRKFRRPNSAAGSIREIP